MNFEFSEEQQMLRDTMSSFLADRFTFEDRRRAVQTERASGGLWKAFAQDLGVLGLSLPEELGGLGGGAVDDMIVMEELGRALSLEPFVASVVMARVLLEDVGEGGRAVLDAVLGGNAVIVPAIDMFPGAFGSDASPLTHSASEAGFSLSGQVSLVHNAGQATHFVLASGTSDGASRALFLVEANTRGVAIERRRLVDGTDVGELTLTEVLVPATALVAAGSEAEECIEAAFDHGVAALCAEALGIQRMLLQWTIEYAKQRQQFGRPIAQFQVLQHRMAEMFIKVEEAASMTYLATIHLASEPADRAKFVSAAKVVSDQSSQFIGQQAVQIHGGMGMSKELPIADYFSRLTVIAQQLGSTEYHRRRYEAASFPQAAA